MDFWCSKIHDRGAKGPHSRNLSDDSGTYQSKPTLRTLSRKGLKTCGFESIFERVSKSLSSLQQEKLLEASRRLRWLMDNEESPMCVGVWHVGTFGRSMYHGWRAINRSTWPFIWEVPLGCSKAILGFPFSYLN